MTEEQRKVERTIARKFHKIGSQIGLNEVIEDDSFDFATELEVLQTKQELDECFECSVSFSWARTVTLGKNYSYTRIHAITRESLYFAVKRQARIYLKSYYFAAGQRWL